MNNVRFVCDSLSIYLACFQNGWTCPAQIHYSNSQCPRKGWRTVNLKKIWLNKCRHVSLWKVHLFKQKNSRNFCLMQIRFKGESLNNLYALHRAENFRMVDIEINACSNLFLNIETNLIIQSCTCILKSV